MENESENVVDGRDEKGRFIKGTSGNPAGKPKDSISIVHVIKKKLQEVPEGQKKTYLELLVDRILRGAIVDGNDQQIKNILQYVEGMPKQNLGVDFDDAITEIKINIVKDGNSDRSN